MNIEPINTAEGYTYLQSVIQGDANQVLNLVDYALKNYSESFQDEEPAYSRYSDGNRYKIAVKVEKL